jgi:RNA polymerase sigma-70 factor (ECF subfamily)
MGFAITDIDAQLIDRIRQGDEDSFACLYAAYFPYMAAKAASMIQDTEEAKDIVNDIFVSVWNNRRKLFFPIHPYLQTAVKNGCLNWIRYSQSKLHMMDSYKSLMEIRMERIYAMESLDVNEVIDAVNLIKKAAQTLPERCRVIFEMYFYLGYNSTEIAEHLGLSASTIRVQLKIALSKLKEEIPPLICFLISWIF